MLDGKREKDKETRRGVLPRLLLFAEKHFTKTAKRA
jgi:hypothetical protein